MRRPRYVLALANSGWQMADSYLLNYSQVGDVQYSTSQQSTIRDLTTALLAVVLVYISCSTHYETTNIFYVDALFAIRLVKGGSSQSCI